MNRYIVFGYDDYYPSGGMSDFQGSYIRIDEAREACKYYQNHHILDQKTGIIHTTHSGTEWVVHEVWCKDKEWWKE